MKPEEVKVHLPALRELAKTGNAEMPEEEIVEVACMYPLAHAFGYVYARTHVDQHPGPPNDPPEGDEAQYEYITGWCDGTWESYRQEMGDGAADALADMFTGQKADYVDILRYYRTHYYWGRPCIVEVDSITRCYVCLSWSLDKCT